MNNAGHKDNNISDKKSQSIKFILCTRSLARSLTQWKIIADDSSRGNPYQ